MAAAAQGPAAGPGLAAREREGGLRRYLEYIGVCPQGPGPRARRRAPPGPGPVRSPACWEASWDSLSGLEKLPPLVPRWTETAQGTHVESWGLPRPLLSCAVDTLRVSLGTGTTPRCGVGAHRPRLAMQTSQCQPISTYNEQSAEAAAAALICPAAAAEPFLCSSCAPPASPRGRSGLPSAGSAGGCRRSRCP